MMDIIINENITAMYFVPSHLQVLIDHPKFDEATAKIHTICGGGEAVPLTLYPQQYTFSLTILF